MKLTNVEWRLVEYGPASAPIPAAGTPATMTFGSAGQISGSGGCNGFSGSYTASADRISFGQLAATLRACAEEAITQQERAVLEALVGDVRYEMVDNRLRIPYGDNNALVFASDARSNTTATAVLQATVRGSATYRQRIALPPDAALTVDLLDTSHADAPATTIAKQTITPTGQVPIAFELPYDPTQIDPRNTYTIRAEIRSGAELLWTTTTAYPVITNGNPTSVEIMLEQVTQ